MKTIENVFYTQLKHPSQVLDIHLPDQESFPVFLYFHGGGIEHGDKAGDRNVFIAELVKKGVAVLSANYRMYPEASYPEFLKDGASAVAWMMAHMEEYGKPTSFFVGGSSAGGYMSQMLCFDKRFLAEHYIDADSITGYIHDAGQPTVHFNVLRERGVDTRKVVIDDAAPIYHITDNRTYAPMQILFAENDMENRPEQTRLLVSTMKHFGCDMDKVDVRYMKGYGHCEYDNDFDEKGNNVFTEMIYEFIKKYDRGEK